MFENPIFENYITNYMEDTQHKINDTIGFEQFKTIFWSKSVPNFIIDLLGYLTGQPDKVTSLFDDINDIYSQRTKEDLNRFVNKNPFNLADKEKQLLTDKFAIQTPDEFQQEEAMNEHLNEI